MTLQQLIGELQTLALAYPPDTPIATEWRDMGICGVTGLSAQSDEQSVCIVIEAQ